MSIKSKPRRKRTAPHGRIEIPKPEKTPEVPWRKRLDEYLAKFPQPSKRAQIAWLRRLTKDENFRDETDRIREQLEDRLHADEKALLAFLQRYSVIGLFNIEKARDAAHAIRNVDSQRVLAHYIDYARRFRLYATRRSEKLKRTKWAFGLHALPRAMTKRMEARIGKRIRSAGEVSPDSYDIPWPFYDSPNLYLRDNVSKRLDKLEARVLILRDDSTNTVLHELEDEFYDPNCLTFVLHGDRPPMILCLIGENTRKEDWRDTATLITAIQQELFVRKSAGRKKNRSRRAAVDKQALLPGRQKEKADLLDLQVKDSSKHEAMSRARKRSRELKTP